MFSKYPSIEQFRNVIKAIERKYMYSYNEDSDEWEYDQSKTMPTLTFSGTVKLHGTNAGVYMDSTGEINAQKRSGVCTPEKDNAGFASWVGGTEITTVFDNIRTHLLSFYKEIEGRSIVVYGEWCGGNIQKGVAIAGLPKMFIVFGVKVIAVDEDDDFWLDISQYKGFRYSEHNIDSIYDFETYSIDIDFNNPKLAVPQLQLLTEQVENKCPVGNFFGNEGVGEGIVWQHSFDDGSMVRFKVKGEKHSSTKVKKLASVDIEKMNSVTEFINYAVTENRLLQAVENTLSVHGGNTTGDVYDFDRKKLGQFIKWVSSDVLKEESDTLNENDLTMKDVGSSLSKKCKDWFFEQELI